MCSMTLQHNVIIYNIRATQIFLKHAYKSKQLYKDKLSKF